MTGRGAATVDARALNRGRKLRLQLVGELERATALRSPNVRAAFLQVPRELFVADFARSEGLDAVYANRLIITKTDARGAPLSSSSEPQIMAAMLERLQLEEGMRVLEVGAGSGYNAALLKALVGERGRVVSVDVDPELARAARRALAAGGYAVRVVCGDGYAGYAPAAPYDRIVATASSDRIPRAWLDQLVEGGLLELPLRLRSEGAQAIATFRRNGNRFESVSVVPGRFMSLRDGIASGPTRPLTVYAALGDGRRILTQLAGPGLAALSAAAEGRLVGVAANEPRRRALDVRFPTWSLGLYLSLEIPQRRLVMRFADLAIGVVGRGGRSLALVEGRWEGGERPTPQRLLAYGDGEAEECLVGILDEWKARGRPGRRQLWIEVDFRAGRSRVRHEWGR